MFERKNEEDSSEVGSSLQLARRCSLRCAGSFALVVLAYWLASLGKETGGLSLGEFFLIALLSAVICILVRTFFAVSSKGPILWLRVGLGACVVASVSYASGWGPVAYGFGILYISVVELSAIGSAALLPLFVTSLVVLAGGQVALGVQLSPAYFGRAELQWVGVLTGVAILAVIGLLGRKTVQAERSDQYRRALEERMRSLIESSGDIVALLDRNGKVVYENRAVEHVVGRKQGAVLGSSVFDLLHPDDVPSMKESFAKALSSNERAARVEFRMRTADGKWRWMEGLGTNLLDDPYVQGVLVTVRDIDERVRLSAEVEELLERFRLTFDNAPIGMMITEPTGNFIEVNQAFANIVGIPKDELVGKSFLSLTHPDDRESSSKAVAGLISGRLNNYSMRKRYVHADGHTIWADLSVSVVRNTKFEPLYLVTQVIDVTDRVRAEEALASSEARLRKVLDTAVNAYVEADAYERVTEWNKKAEELFGWSREEVLGRWVFELLYPARYRGEYRAAFSASLKGRDGEGGMVKSDTLFGLHRSGREFPMDTVLWSTGEGKSKRFHAFMADITERVATHRLWEQIIDSGPEATLLVDDQGVVQLANREATAVFGYSKEEMIGLSVEMLIPERYRKEHIVDREIYARDPQRREMGSRRDIYARRKDGGEFPAEVSLSPFQGPDGMLVTVVVRDVTARRQAEEQLTYQALHDSLTGLANRALLMDRLAQAIASRGRNPRPLAVLFLDLDRFKFVNDTLGHGAGDELLIEVSTRLRNGVRAGDTVARFGGDEFVILLDDSADHMQSPTDAMVVAERISSILAVPLRAGGRNVQTGASIGVRYVQAGEWVSTSSLLREADVALYQAKTEGRGRVVLFSSGLADTANKRWRLAEELERCIADRSLAVHYQPEVDLTTNQLVRLEALARLPGSDGTVHAAESFIDVADDFGLLVKVDELVMRQAVRDAAAWQELPSWPENVGVAINVSPGHLIQTRFPTTLEEALSRYDLDPSLLLVEITESAALDSSELARESLNALSRMGVRLGIDDFGTKYSSFSSLSRTHFDVIKIDKSFVANLPDSERDRGIVESIVNMAAKLDLVVVAEGIEREEQMEYLRSIGCPIGQGFYFSQALPFDDLELWIENKGTSS
ncbi:MAG: PAS domain S-box protein [Actinobacteria bacterium]|jgi:diguanylate cyclase (GGDEF)-like protein/PAS domain S-box-containing protein|nr:PAS domain S-box protein [Actinomycetota bacterium]MCL6095454.1 PAS domain S-box protein [Actinomycetota bacterium]